MPVDLPPTQLTPPPVHTPNPTASPGHLLQHPEQGYRRVQLLVNSRGAVHWVLGNASGLQLPTLARLAGEGGGLHTGANNESMCLFHAQQDRSIQAGRRPVLIPKGAATPYMLGAPLLWD